MFFAGYPEKGGGSWKTGAKIGVLRMDGHEWLGTSPPPALVRGCTSPREGLPQACQSYQAGNLPTSLP